MKIHSKVLKFRNLFIKVGDVWTTIVNIQRNFENNIAKMRKCLKKFRWIRIGAKVAYSPWQSRVPCALSFLYFTQTSLHCCGLLVLLRGCVFRSDDACQKRFSWFPDWIQKVQKCVNLGDLVKSFKFKRVFTCKHRRRYSQEKASQSLPKNLQKVGKKLEKT